MLFLPRRLRVIFPALEVVALDEPSLAFSLSFPVGDYYT
jgi:hypothetical protein